MSDGQIDVEGAALARPCINVNETVVAHDDAVNNRNPKARSLAFCFVVKNGSKICCRMFSSIPGPVSATAMQT
jgi:hypothetical protein